jgi:hypothetical protein
MAATFSFDTMKVTTAKADEIPVDTKVRITVNPFTDAFAASLAKSDDGVHGEWKKVNVPGTPTTSDKGRTSYGDVVTKALYFITRAAKNAGVSSDRRVVDKGNGTVDVFFRSAKIDRTRKPKGETAPEDQA